MAPREELAFQVKRFIVQRLACHDTPLQVARAVKDEFGIEVSRQRVHCYDPTSKAGASLDPALKKLFEETREKFLADINSIPIANKAVRLRHLQRQLEYFSDKNAAGIVLELCESAAKEIGDAFTNRQKHEVTGKDGAPLAATIVLTGRPQSPSAS